MSESGILVTRRTLLRAGLAAATAGVTAGCVSRPQDFVASSDAEVREAEASRRPGAIRDVTLRAEVGPVDLGGLTVTTWQYGGNLPGRPIRVTAGEQIRATLINQLPSATTVHWHGLSLRNDADGVPDVTQPEIAPGADFTYRFTASNPGTFWFHPHHGLQLDRGLYAPLIIDDPHEPLSYDDEWIVVLDDWLDGVAGTPEQTLADLRRSAGGMMGGHMGSGLTSALLGGNAGDVTYPHYLLNGRLPQQPVTYQGRPGTRLRIRLINAGADTAFRVVLGGHRMTLTHTDGFAIEPVVTDALLLGMGERYDVLVTLADGVFPLVALAEGKGAAAFGLVRTGSGQAPPTTVRPGELGGRIVSYRAMAPAETVRLTDRAPDRTIRLELTGAMMSYAWGFNGRAYDPGHLEPVRAGERVRLELVNTTMMWHPIHLHGHTFAIGDTGTRKDTAIVLPGQRMPIHFDADNPGRWAVHCHNAYHAETGMMTLLGYLRGNRS